MKLNVAYDLSPEMPIEYLEDEVESCLRSESGVAKEIFRRRSWEVAYDFGTHFFVINSIFYLSLEVLHKNLKNGAGNLLTILVWSCQRNI